jgi:hypothetical protein
MGRLARVDTFGKCAHWVLLDIFGFYGALRALERFGKMRALGACRNFRVYGALCALGHFWKMRALGACRYFRILWRALRVWTLSENARTGYFSTFSDFTARCARLDASGKCAHWALVENSDFMARCARLDTFGKCAHWALVDEVRKRM